MSDKLQITLEMALPVGDILGIKETIAIAVEQAMDRQVRVTDIGFIIEDENNEQHNAAIVGGSFE